MTSNTPATITVADLAEALGTDPRTTRKFLRSVTDKADQPGKGSRWSIEKKSLNALKKQFATYLEARRANTEDDDAEEATAE